MDKQKRQAVKLNEDYTVLKKIKPRVCSNMARLEKEW